MTANVGTITPSNNLNQWSRNYNPALFLGNISIAQFLNVQLAPATDGLVYNAGTILARYTSGPNVGKYVNYVTGGTNGQDVMVGVLSDNRVPTNYTTPAANDRLQMVYGGANIFLQYLYTPLGTSADVLVALATMGARTYNSTFAYLP